MVLIDAIERFETALKDYGLKKGQGAPEKDAYWALVRANNALCNALTNSGICPETPHSLDPLDQDIFVESCGVGHRGIIYAVEQYEGLSPALIRIPKVRDARDWGLDEASSVP